jgi:radical SAM superfamily enzyme YgiQ (UPF0313 family)
MNILLVYPFYPDTFWSFRHALAFVSKKATIPPLGLITISAMLPVDWNRKLVDLNVTSLAARDILWADFVFISAMSIQKESVKKILAECKRQDAKVVAGGPLFTASWDSFPEVDHFILNEAEITLPKFLADLKEGIPKKIYKTDEYPDISSTPIPDYQLLSINKYASMNIQYSRGCPFACDFCEITWLFGHKVRTKQTAQILNELDKLYELHWKGPVFFVDDNFIGNSTKLKNDLLPALYEWMKIHDYPFTFNTAASINIADDDDLISMMTKAGFDSVFIGIETPEADSLDHCNKLHNKNRNLLENVRKIQRSGVQVTAGFIVGFDSDTSAVFQNQIDFIQQSGIVTAMVGLLNAPQNTKLYQRLLAENRLIKEFTGNNTSLSINFIPKMNLTELLEGYKNIIHNIYSIKPYYQRIRRLILNFSPKIQKFPLFSYTNMMAFIKSAVIIGFLKKGRSDYWILLFWCLFHKPKSIAQALTFMIYGYHFRKIFGLSR